MLLSAHFILAIMAASSQAGVTEGDYEISDRDSQPSFHGVAPKAKSVAYTVDGRLAARGTASKSGGRLPDTTAGSEASVTLSDVGSVSSLSVDVEVEFEHPGALVRVVMVDKAGREFLVYESHPSLERNGHYRVRATATCEETCQLDPTEPVELRLQAIAARLGLLGIHFGSTGSIGVLRDGHDDERRYFKVAQLRAAKADKRISWDAGDSEVAKMTYAQKRRMFSGGRKTAFLPNLQGLEFYQDGVFDGASGFLAAGGLPESNTSGNVPSGDVNLNCGAPMGVFDWRSRHGKNYVTEVKNQGYSDQGMYTGCGSCWAFAAVGAAEARILTYYNDPKLNVVLAEQEAVCVTGHSHFEGYWGLVIPVWITYADGCNGGWPQGAYETMTNPGLPLRVSMPYQATDDAGVCSVARAALGGAERWRSVGIEAASRNVASLKGILSRGPTAICIDSWDHCVVVVGYEDYSCGVAWILKNSWGPGWGHSGYVKTTLNLNDVGWQAYGMTDVSIRAPTQMVPVNAAAPAVVCEDKDYDRFCNWGTGPKPSTCPSTCFDVPDGDDLTCNYPYCGVGPGQNCETISTACGTAYCGACPSGQVCLSNNSCCTPRTQRQACGLQCAGTASNGCGGQVTCSSSVCKSGVACVGGECSDCMSGSLCP